MNLSQLINKTTKHFVTVENGIGELIDYKHESLGETITDVSVSPQEGNYKHLNDERIKDAMSFMAVFLDIKPEKNDIITYNDIKWKVELFNGTNPYDIVAYRKKNTITPKPRK